MIAKNLLEQIKQRTDKLIEEQDKLESLEFRYNLGDFEDRSIVKDQEELVEFLTGKLKNSISTL